MGDSTMPAPFLRFDGIAKTFPGVKARQGRQLRRAERICPCVDGGEWRGQEHPAENSLGTVHA